jgi:hypothetical protein
VPAQFNGDEVGGLLPVSVPPARCAYAVNKARWTSVTNWAADLHSAASMPTRSVDNRVRPRPAHI